MNPQRSDEILPKIFKFIASHRYLKIGFVFIYGAEDKFLKQ